MHMYMSFYWDIYLLTAGIQLLSESLDHCREISEQASSDAYENLRKHVLATSPARTLYTLEVGLV